MLQKLQAALRFNDHIDFRTCVGEPRHVLKRVKADRILTHEQRPFYTSSNLTALLELFKARQVERVSQSPVVPTTTYLLGPTCDRMFRDSSFFKYRPRHNAEAIAPPLVEHVF